MTGRIRHFAKSASVGKDVWRFGRDWMDSIVALSAIVISVASLWVAVREGRTQERLLAASVWPYLQYGSADIAPATGVEQIDFTLQNAGVGPALIRWVTFYYNGRAYATARDALGACCGAKGALPTITEGLHRVLTPGQLIPFLHLPKRRSDLALWQRLDHIRQTQFSLRACYCSVLDDCWLFDSRRRKPQPVGDCPAADTPEWNG